MQEIHSPKVLGATVVGLALVGGAYTLSSMRTPLPDPVSQAATVNGISTERVAITVTDADNNGIEDWRDEFVSATPPIYIESEAEDVTPYETPTTLTGQMGVNFMEKLINNRLYAPIAGTDDQAIQEVLATIKTETDVTLYDMRNIDVIEDWSDQDIVNYANTLAIIIQKYNVTGLEGELMILSDILKTNNPARISELEQIANVYRNYREDTLLLPVPAFLAKEHLDLINTFSALAEDVEAMTLAFDDPARAMLRLKRYEDDATGLGYAFQNMYFALEPYATLFTVEDPAVLFVTFSPNLQR